MQLKVKNISIIFFLINAILLIINIKYKDEIVSVIHDLDHAKLFFYLGILCFVTYLIISKLKKAFTILLSMAIISFCFSMFFNLRLAKDNYDRIQCEKGISEYFKYFEYESCEKIKNRFEEDLINGELKYFQDEYDSDLEFEERLKDKNAIELIGISCTRFTSMDCYNDLVKDYISKKDN
ncbi:hypothetical protein [Lacinutrix sp. MEBiC02595]